MDNDIISQSEAVTAFAAWLTTRDEVLKVGATKNAAKVAELTAAFVESQDFEIPRDNYTDLLKPYPTI